MSCCYQKCIKQLPQEAKEENKEIVHEGEVKDIEEAKIQELIIEKDQEIMNLKDKIELKKRSMKRMKIKRCLKIEFNN